MTSGERGSKRGPPWAGRGSGWFKSHLAVGRKDCSASIARCPVWRAPERKSHCGAGCTPGRSHYEVRHIQLPWPWLEGAELRLFQEAPDQVELNRPARHRLRLGG